MADSLESLAASLTRVAALIQPAARVVVDENAAAVQQRWRSTFPWSGSRHLRTLGASVTTERFGNLNTAGADIGPVKGGQGSLGHLIEFGSVNSGAHPGGGPAAMAQAPVFLAAMGVVAQSLLAGRADVSMATSTPSRYNAPIGPR